MIQSLSAGGVIINEGKVVIVNQGGRSWSLPKGHVEKGESPLQAAKREIYEECGLSGLTFVRELGSYRRDKATKYRGRKEMKTIHMFLFTTAETLLKPRDRTIREAVWIDKKKVAEMLSNNSDRAFFLSVLELI